MNDMPKTLTELEQRLLELGITLNITRIGVQHNERNSGHYLFLNIEAFTFIAEQETPEQAYDRAMELFNSYTAKALVGK